MNTRVPILNLVLLVVLVGITAVAFFILYIATGGWEGTSVEFMKLHDYVPVVFALAVVIELGVFSYLHARPTN